MIPVSPISERQQGLQNYSLPPIKLGSSLARAAGEPLSTIRPTIQLHNKRRNSYRKLKGARRVSDILQNLPRIHEITNSTKGNKNNKVLNLEDLRRKRMMIHGHVRKDSTELEQIHRYHREKFRRIAHKVLIIARMCISMKSYMKEETNPNWSLMEMTLSIQDHFDRILSFRPADKWKTPSQNGRLETVLRIPPRFRSFEHNRTIKALMRGHTAFEDYPEHIQYELCNVMFYQRYESRRVVTRIDQKPTAFFMILSGVVLVNIPEQNEEDGRRFMRTVNELSKGDIFGEVALITGGVRNATIICKTDVELVIIDKEDFDRIIKASLIKQIDNHLGYVEKLELFKHFPCEVLRKNPDGFFYQYFKPNMVIITNSLESSYLVIVMSGKCRAVSAYRPPKKTEYDEDEKLLKKQLEIKFPIYTEKLKRRRISMKRRNISDLENTAALEFNIKSQEIDQLAPLTSEFNQRFPPISANKRAQRRRSSSLTGFYETVEKEKVTNPNLWSNRLSQTLKTEQDVADGRSKEYLTTIKEGLELKKERRKDAVAKWKKIASVAAMMKTPKLVTADGEVSMRYAQLAEFDEGNVFGLETLLQKDASSAISLVSDGAECIFISKKLFMDNANAKVFRVVSDLVVAYPTTEFIDNYIRRQKKWKDFKLSLVGKHSKLTASI